MDNLILAYGLIALGLVLLAAELFVPTGGILFVLAVGALVVGVAMTFAESTGGSMARGVVTLIAIVVIIPIVGPILIHYWPKTPVGRRFFLNRPDEDDTLANMPVNLELEQLRGRYGRTVSWLRPAGVALFDGRRIDIMSEGGMIEPGAWVRCIDVKAGKVIVRQVERPPDLADMEPADLQ
jgi:membrane-bound serine protease (ClpP class)